VSTFAATPASSFKAVAGIRVKTGQGYRHQLTRTRRYLHRLTALHDNEMYYQDDILSFFQNCWHVKDWLRNDPSIPQDVKDKVESAALADPMLKVCYDLATAAKHLVVRKAKANATHLHYDIVMEDGKSVKIDTLIDSGEIAPREALYVAADCFSAWERILRAEGLSTDLTLG
jgi:hypothetical protein